MQRLVQPSLHPCASTTKVRSFFSLAPLSATSALSQGHRLVRTEPVQASLALPTQSAGRSYHSPPSRHQVFSFFGGDRADDNNKTKDKDGDIAKSGDVMDDAMQDEDMFDDDEDYEEESIFQDIDLNDGNIIHQSHSQFSSDIRVVEYGYGIRELVIGQSNATSSTANSHGKSNGDPAASSAAEHRPSQLAAGYHLTQSLVKLKEPQLLLLPHTMQVSVCRTGNYLRGGKNSGCVFLCCGCM